MGLIFFFGGRVTSPKLFGKNLLVRVKLGYTPNFTSLCHLEEPLKLVVVVGGWCKPILVFIFRPLVELNNKHSILFVFVNLLTLNSSYLSQELSKIGD